MREHVGASCGAWLILFPVENIVSIEPVQNQTRFCGWRYRNRANVGEPVLDVRRLLGVPEPGPPEDGVSLQWRSTDGARRLTLLVDAVEEIATVEGVDLLFVGPNDLSASLGHFGDQDHPNVRAAIDRIVEDGGFLLIGDFAPSNRVRVRYHHLPDQDVFTYKQNYAELFTSSGIYQLRAMATFGHGGHVPSLSPPEAERTAIWLLRKSLRDSYTGSATSVNE